MFNVGDEQCVLGFRILSERYSVSHIWNLMMNIKLEQGIQCRVIQPKVLLLYTCNSTSHTHRTTIRKSRKTSTYRYILAAPVLDQPPKPPVNTILTSWIGCQVKVCQHYTIYTINILYTNISPIYIYTAICKAIYTICHYYTCIIIINYYNYNYNNVLCIAAVCCCSTVNCCCLCCFLFFF